MFRHRIKDISIRLLITFVFAAKVAISQGEEIVWLEQGGTLTFEKQTTTSPVVDIALDMLRTDLEAVTGRADVLAASKRGAMLRIVQIDRATRSQLRHLSALGIRVDSLRRMDAFYLGEHDGRLMAVGNNGRGVAYALLELSRAAGVSPWIWWSDNAPLHSERLTLPRGFHTLQVPSVERRGIFINDEDWSLQPWSWQTFEKGNPAGMIGARTYKELFKLLLRLRANMMWPAMHEHTVPFYMVPGAKAAADSCAIIIGTSHCEPLMRNNAGEWDVRRRGPYNYITNREAVRQYWTERLRQVAGSDNVYTIGMRGIHDGSMEGVKTLQEKTDALQMVIDDQREMLRRYVNDDVTAIPQAFVPYKEVLDIMENGLLVPDDVTLIWCDDNYGYMTRLSDSVQQQRSGGSGVYYHLSYWGRPHDHLWLTTLQPGLLYNEMMEAYRHNARREWIVNIHDPKPAAYQLELFLDMAWNIHAVNASTLEQHLQRWLCREFGQPVGKRLLPVMTEYYRLTAMRKPEHMGWTQVELDRKLYPRGRSQVRDTDFSFSAFGGEAQRYMSAYAKLADEVGDIERILPPEKRDAYMSHVKYQLWCAAAMSVKMLQAQRARSFAQGESDAERPGRERQMRLAAAKSIRAYQIIQTLTDQYNNSMAGGRWHKSMTYRPRDLFVFDPPSLPIGLRESEVEQLLNMQDGQKTLWSLLTADSGTSHDMADSSYIAHNACDYQTAGPGIETIQLLGHSLRAVSVPRGQQLCYSFATEQAGEAMLRLAFIPTQPNDRGDVRYTWQIDDGDTHTVSIREPNRNEKWKQNVMRGQDLRSFPVTLEKGKHVLKVTALDNHIIMDQWMVDFLPKRQFYLFPVQSTNRKDEQ